MRVAILGGSFDPVHKGHIQIAKTALKQLSIDELWFMPCKETPLKDMQTASFQDRCNMIKLAIKPYRKMKLCKLEGSMEGKSYTIHTLLALKQKYPQATFSWLIGDDQAKQFHLWKDSEQVKREAGIYVFSREEDILLQEGLHRIMMPLLKVSSTQIRQGLQLHQVPEATRIYMGEHALYLEDMVQHRMSEQRFMHSQSVAKLCVELAHAHGLDENVAYQMGILHDICKAMPKDKAMIWITHQMREALAMPSAIWHGYIGAYVSKHYYKIRDKRILSAIYHHVLGDGKSDYDRILFICDKLDPLRGYDVKEQVELCKQNLKAGFYRVKSEQEAYLIQEGKIKPQGAKNE